jgi:ATP-dependent Clp protease ATP-binding subunit ClpA
VFQKFTDSFRIVLAHAHFNAQSLQCRIVEPIHVLMALLERDTGIGTSILAELGVDLVKAHRAAEALAKEQSETGARTSTLTAIVEESVSAGRTLGKGLVGTEHLALALLRDAAGPGPIVFGPFSVTASRYQEALEKLNG